MDACHAKVIQQGSHKGSMIGTLGGKRRARSGLTDALAKVLIEKGLITREEFMQKISEERATY
jgi:hypothetical protein